MSRQLRVPRHRATTAHLCSAYSFLAEAGLGHRGVYLGTNLLTGGGGFAYDPFEAYQAGLVTNPNLLVAGEPGTGKSSFVKCFLNRALAIFNPTQPANHPALNGARRGRWIAIVDPKGEYIPLAAALGLDVVQLYPGGPNRINPLDPGPLGAPGQHDELTRRQADLITTLLTRVLRRDLEPLEDAALTWALHSLKPDVHTPTLEDLVRVLRDPSPTMAQRARLDPDRLAVRLEALVYALEKLLERSLRGMFDGPTTIHVNWTGTGLVLDLSVVHHDDEALRLVLLAATAWLQTVLARRDGIHRLQILDEAWRLLGAEQTTRYLQACWKLCRDYGVANLAVVHRLSDLRAQADDGTSTAKVSMGLLSDTQTRVLFRQASDQLTDARDLLGLNTSETDLLGRLAKGRALWKIAGHTAVVQHHVAPHETLLCDTDTRMRT